MSRSKGRAVTVALTALVALALVGTGGAAGGKLKCFVGSPATCVLNPSTNGATLDTTSGGYAGVYYTNGKSFNGSTLGSVDFSFDYRCQPSNTDTTTCVGGGAPRWSIPISTDANTKTTEVYAFLDAANCGSTGTVSTNLASCPVFLNSGPSFANWNAFAAAQPTYTISGSYPFVIADVGTAAPIVLYDVSVTK